MNFKYNKGFNLVELLIVVVIIGVLAAIAIPSYRSHIVSSSRAAAQTELLQLASMQEKIYLNSSAYTNVAASTAYNGTTTGGLGKGATNDGKYTITNSSVDGQTFTITATPVAGTTQEGDGDLTISENGEKLWNGNPW